MHVKSDAACFAGGGTVLSQASRTPEAVQDAHAMVVQTEWTQNGFAVHTFVFKYFKMHVFMHTFMHKLVHPPVV